MNDAIKLISRILMSAVFIVYGSMKFMDVTSVAGSAATKRFMDLVGSGAVAPTWLGYMIAAIEVLGGLAILVGFKTRWAAWGLFAWLVIVTLLGHPFWLLDGQPRAINMSHFYKNLAIMAAYLLLAIGGPGRYSVDNRTAV